MSIAKLRRRVNERWDMPRLGKSPSTVIDVDTGEALCDLADAARRHLSDQEPTCRCEHEMADALKRLDGKEPVDTRPTVDLGGEDEGSRAEGDNG